MVPGHFFVRTRGAHPRNLELLRRGEAMPDAWYLAKYGPWPEGGSGYFRPITVAELVGLHWFNAGNFLRAKGDLAGAKHAFARAVEEFPAFAEAQASLGAIHQLEGALPEAQIAYDRAGRARPDLPGLEENRALLRQELPPSPVKRRPSP
jgi:tetratricopeptide (TPR) repeat protein